MRQAFHDNSLAKRIAQVRQSNGLSQEEFARALGISRSGYQFYERNEREIPFTVIKRCADIFEIDLLWLAYDDGEERVLERDNKLFDRLDEIYEFIDDWVRENGRRISRENRARLARHLYAAYWLKYGDLRTIKFAPRQEMNNVIEMVSYAA
ncbi:MAG: helix-turn-helix transcriptional regulator [Kangiellaceae bacterium]|nr:helix-turn-helix transcriptional regulator [Kangiellaceae bacterium]